MIYLRNIFIAFLFSYSSLSATYTEMKTFVLSNVYSKKRLMTEEEFDHFCEDAENCPVKGYRDSTKAAKEAPEYEDNPDYQENPDYFKK